MTQHPAFIPAPDQAPQLPELPSSVAADPSRNHLEVAFPRSLGRSTELGEQREADVGIVEIAHLLLDWGDRFEDRVGWLTHSLS